MKFCSFEGCGRKHAAKGLCISHYENQRRSGKPLKPLRGWDVEHDTCPHGHPWTAENIYISPRGHKNCRICARKRTSEWKAKQKALAR